MFELEELYSTAEVAAAWKVTPGHVAKLARSGQLDATNMADSESGRAIWRISGRAIARFREQRGQVDTSGRPTLTLVPKSAVA